MTHLKPALALFTAGNLLLALILPATSLANPLVDYPLKPDSAVVVAVPLLLVAEGVILALLARRTRPFFARFVGAWTLVTTVTFLLLMKFMGLAGYLGGTWRFGTVSISDQQLAGVLGEIAVTVVEGIVLSKLLRLPNLTRRPEAAPALGTCLLYSLAANAVSFSGGVLVEDLPGKVHDLVVYLRWVI